LAKSTISADFKETRVALIAPAWCFRAAPLESVAELPLLPVFNASTSSRFAAALLTPTTLSARDIRRFGSPETEHILALATRYQVSKKMAARRYTELCDHVCAVIFSRRGAVRYFLRSRTCPFLDIAKGDSLPSGSLSARGPRRARASI
jgi:hypothetical protein